MEDKYNKRPKNWRIEIRANKPRTNTTEISIWIWIWIWIIPIWIDTIISQTKDRELLVHFHTTSRLLVQPSHLLRTTKGNPRSGGGKQKRGMNWSGEANSGLLPHEVVQKPRPSLLHSSQHLFQRDRDLLESGQRSFTQILTVFTKSIFICFWKDVSGALTTAIKKEQISILKQLIKKEMTWLATSAHFLVRCSQQAMPWEIEIFFSWLFTNLNSMVAT